MIVRFILLTISEGIHSRANYAWSKPFLEYITPSVTTIPLLLHAKSKTFLKLTFALLSKLLGTALLGEGKSLSSCQ